MGVIVSEGNSGVLCGLESMIVVLRITVLYGNHHHVRGDSYVRRPLVSEIR